MKKTSRKKPPSAEAIAKLADKGKSVLSFYEGRGRMVQPETAPRLDAAKPSDASLKG